MYIKASGGFGNKLYKYRYLIIAAVIMAVILLIGYFIVSKSTDNKNFPAEKKVSSEESMTDTKLKNEGIKLKSKFLIDNRDAKASDFVANREVTIRITLENNSSQQSRFLTIKTKLKPANLYSLKNYSNITGIANRGSEIEIKNVLMNAHQIQEFSFDGTLAGNENDEISLQPSLVDTDNQTVATGQMISYKITKSS